MRRVSISEIMQATGLSRATVDRVLNGRGRVHARTREAVEATLRRLSQPDQPPPATGPRADLILRVGRGMMGQMRAAWDKQSVQGRFHDLHMGREDAVLQAVSESCRDLTQPLIITAKTTPRLVAALRDARSRGKRIIAAVSDLPREARDAFVGIDDRAAGQTAAFLVGRALGDRPTTVGVVLGDAAFRNHADREIGFRTGLRANFPRVVISGEAQGEDSAAQTKEAVLRMLRDHPALAAVYNVGGGNQGMIDAIAAAGRDQDLLVVGHEVNAVTTPLLREARMDYALAGDPSAILSVALRLSQHEGPGLPEQTLLDFAVYTRFNLPGFAAGY